jgi:hypothetical protein
VPVVDFTAENGMERREGRWGLGQSCADHVGDTHGGVGDLAPDDALEPAGRKLMALHEDEGAGAPVGESKVSALASDADDLGRRFYRVHRFEVNHLPSVGR